MIAYLYDEMAILDTEQLRIFIGRGDDSFPLAESSWQGTASQVSVRCRDVVGKALSLNASTLIMAHNHPSGDPRPSEGDIAFTRRIYVACKALEIVVADHIIVAKRGICSFREEGYL